MPNLDDITAKINASLQAGNFASRRFQPSAFYGIADRVKITGEDGGDRFEPQIVDDDGEGTSLVYDDTNALQVYHVIDSLEYPRDENVDFGKPGTTLQEIASMRMVIAGLRSRLKVRPENVIAAAVADFPKEFVPADITPLQMNSCVIEIESVDDDQYRIWDDQFQGSEFALSTNTILVAIRYKITNNYNKNCFSLCN